MSRFIDRTIPFYLDDGSVNSLGTVYFGVAGQDAKTNPAQIYFDKELTIPAPATQSLTAGGQLVGNLYANEGDLSLISDNSFGVQVESFLYWYQDPKGYVIREEQTSSDGQSVFVLQTTSYKPGSGNLSVFVNGVFYTDFTETDSTTITFDTALEAGNEVLFIINNNVASSFDIPAEKVSVTVDGNDTNVSDQLNAVDASINQIESDIDAIESFIYSGADGPVELIAHRGFRDTNYQNTLLAFSYALNQGADSLECDASISADGVWYLFHDATVDALTDGTGGFTSLNSSYIDTLSYTKAAGTPNDGLGITRLSDFLNFVREKGVLTYIEAKGLRNETTDLDSLLSEVESYGLLTKVVMQGSTTASVERMVAYSSSVKVGFLLDSSDISGSISLAQSSGAKLIINNYLQYIANPTMASDFAAAGLDSIAYTVDRARQFNELTAVGVRKIMSDRSTVK